MRRRPRRRPARAPRRQAAAATPRSTKWRTGPPRRRTTRTPCWARRACKSRPSWRTPGAGSSTTSSPAPRALREASPRP
eukprot:517294-Alexandrium_andersonii.AAC.1